MGNFRCELIQHSMNPVGDEAITYSLCYERFIHAEVMTHCAFNRNASSSRAIPYKKMKEWIMSDPAMPLHLGTNRKGMQAGEEVSKPDECRRDIKWMLERMYLDLDEFTDRYELHKEIVNRYSEPWGWINVVITTGKPGLMNMFNLRCTPYAHPNFQRLAVNMARLYRESNPFYLEPGQWHLPFVDGVGVDEQSEQERLVWSVARCAWTSYRTVDGREGTWEDARRRHDDCVNFKHMCYDDKTDVLTKNGWINWNEASDDIEYAVFHHDGRITYEKPSYVHHSEYSGKMYELISQQVNLVVTPNHRMYVRTRNSGFKFEDAGYIAGKERYYLKSGNLDLNERIKNETPYPPELIGFFAGDGHVIGKNAIGFNVHKERKINYLKSIGFDRTIKQDGIGDWFSKNCISPNGEKMIPREFVLSSQENIKKLLDGLKNSDGTPKNNSWVYHTTSEILKDQLLEIAALNGFVFTHSSYVLESGKNYHRLIYSKRNEPGTRKDCESIDRFIQYNGKVHCVSVSTGILIVRRNNKVVICGNTPCGHQLRARADHGRNGGSVAGFDMYRHMIPGESASEFNWEEFDRTYGEDKDFVVK